MKNMSKRLLSVALVFLMLFTMVPMYAFAEDSYTTETESDLDFELNNALSSAINDAYSEELAFQKSTPCYINDIVIEGNTATVDLFALYDVTVVVAIYTENGSKMITSAKTTVTANESTATVTFNTKLPVDFLIKAFMLDENLSPLGDVFTSIEYTKAYKDFDKKTIKDFDAEKVINLDEHTDNNFVVVSKDAKVIKKVAGKNNVVKADFENGVYVIEDATEEVEELEEDDVIYYVFASGVNDYILTKVGSVENNGGTVTITTADDCDFNELFSHIKIDVDPEEEPTEDETEEEEKTTFSYTATVSADKEFGGCSLSLKGTADFLLDFDFKYDESWSSIFEDFQYELLLVLTSTFTLDAEFEAKYEKEEKFELIDVTTNIVPAIALNIRVKLTVNFEAKFTATGNLTLVMVNGAKITNGTISENRSQPPKFTYVFDGTGEVEFSLTPELILGLQGLRFIEIAFGVEPTVTVHAEIEFFQKTNDEEEFPEEKHECDKCIEGEINININFKISLNLVFGKNRKELLGWTYPVHSGKLSDFYISLQDNGGGKYSIKEWDMTTCPHKLYRVYLFIDCSISNDEDHIASYFEINSDLTLNEKNVGIFVIGSDGCLHGILNIPNGYTSYVYGSPLYLKKGIYQFMSVCADYDELFGGSSIKYIDKATTVKVICGATTSGAATDSKETINTTKKVLSNEIQLTTTVSNTTAGNNYVVVALKTIQTEDLLAPENLLYIDQKKASDDTVTFKYLIDKNVPSYEVEYFSAEGYNAEPSEKCTHSFTHYVSDKNATYTSDGTKTAYCDNACGARDTVTDVGSKLKLGKTSKITATQTTNTVKLNWSAVDGANIYRVYQKNGSSWKKLADVTSLNYTIKNLKAGTKYSFAVKAGVKADGKITWASGYTTIDTVTKAVKPSKITATQTTSTIKLTWNVCTGATGYRIYYKSGDTWKVAVKATTATSHTFKNLKAGAKFTFAVRPYIKTDSGVVWSDYTTFKASTVPSNPTLKVTTPSKGKLTVNWKAVNGAEGYQLWYKTGNGAYKLYKTYTKAGTLNFSNLKSGTKYTFAVRAVIKTDGGNVRSGYKAATVTVK